VFVGCLWFRFGTAGDDARRIRRVDCQARGIRYKLSKIVYYLIDNIYNLILSSLMDRVQEESGRTEEHFQNWNTGAWDRWVTTTSSFSGGEPRPSGAWTGHPRELNERDCPGHPPVLRIVLAVLKVRVKLQTRFHSPDDHSSVPYSRPVL